MGTETGTVSVTVTVTFPLDDTNTSWEAYSVSVIGCLRVVEV